MKVECCAFELQADRGVEFFNYETGAELLTLTGEQVREFTSWHNDGSCPVCHVEINQGEIVCDDCFDSARRFPPRADALLAEVASQ